MWSGAILFVEKSVVPKKCLFLIPIPKPLSPGKGLNVGLPPSPRLGLRPKPHFQKLYRFFDRLPLPADVVGSDFMFCFILLLSVFQHLGGCDFVQLSYKKRACEKIYQHNGYKQSGI